MTVMVMIVSNTITLSTALRNEYDDSIGQNIATTITIIRSAVSDNNWVCQMDWVPALSQVSRLPYSIHFFDFEFVLVSLCFMTNPKNQKYEEEKKAGKSAGVGAFVAKSLSLVNILPWGSAWYAPLWLAQVSFFFVFELASYHQFHQQSNHIHHHYQHLYHCTST